MVRGVLCLLALSELALGSFLGHGSVAVDVSTRSPPRAAVCMLAKKGGRKKAERAAAAATPVVEEEQAPAAAAEAPSPPAPPGEAFALAAGAWEQRVDAAPPTFDAVLAALSKSDSHDEFVRTNRDLLDYRFLWRLTAEMLRAQNTGQSDRAASLKELRARTIRAAQAFDAPLFKQVAEAEGRLGQVLALYMQKKPPPPSETARAAGTAPIEVLAFWIVIVSAMAAWESKLAVPSVAGLAKGKLEELGEVLGALEESPGLLDSAGVTPLATLLRGPNMAVQAEWDATAAKGSLEGLSLGEERSAMLVRSLGCLYCQVQRHAFQAYNPMTQKCAALYDALLYGAPQPLQPQDIASPPRTEYTSNLVRLAEDADKFLENPPELFW